jgi:hypothetical protein
MNESQIRDLYREASERRFYALLIEQQRRTAAVVLNSIATSLAPESTKSAREGAARTASDGTDRYAESQPNRVKGNPSQLSIRTSREALNLSPAEVLEIELDSR